MTIGQAAMQKTKAPDLPTAKAAELPQPPPPATPPPPNTPPPPVVPGLGMVGIPGGGMMPMQMHGMIPGMIPGMMPGAGLVPGTLGMGYQLNPQVAMGAQISAAMQAGALYR